MVSERQTIYHKRHALGQPYPWTSDRILDENRFTNIYRETDPGTQYAIANILETDQRPLDKAFNIMIYRLIGRKETHQTLGFMRLMEFDQLNFRGGLRAIAPPIFTSAYTVCPWRVISPCKIENVAELVSRLVRDLPSLWGSVQNSQSMQSAYTALHSCQGYGDFLAYQCLVDFTYPVKGGALVPLNPDEWAAAGPGAKKGIEAIAGYPVTNRDKQLQVMQWLHRHQEREFARLGLDFPRWRNLPISLPNIQNSLCSFQKYVKLQGGGRYPIKYKPSLIVE